MEIAVSLQDSCTSERKYAVLLFPWIFFFFLNKIKHLWLLPVQIQVPTLPLLHPNLS